MEFEDLKTEEDNWPGYQMLEQNLNSLHNDSGIADGPYSCGYTDQGRFKLVYRTPNGHRYESGTDQKGNFGHESHPKDVQEAFSLFNALPKGESLTSSLLEKRRSGVDAILREAGAEFNRRKGYVDLDTFTKRLLNHMEKTTRVGTSTLGQPGNELTSERLYCLVRQYGVLDQLSVFGGTGESTEKMSVRFGDDEWDVDSDDSDWGDGGDIECWSGEVIDISEAGGWKS